MAGYLSSGQAPPGTDMGPLTAAPRSGYGGVEAWPDGPEDRQVANEALGLLRRMALVNLEAALSFDHAALRRLHVDMSRDDAQLADQLMVLGAERGWLPPPARVPYAGHPVL